MAKYLLIPALLLLSITAFAQKQEEGIGSGIIYGTNHAYSLSAPKGWVMDNQSGVGQGVFAVFYPHGSSWENGTAVMNTSVITKRDAKQSFDDVIRDEQADSRKHFPSLKIVDAPGLPTRRGDIASVKYLTGDSAGNFEAIAYINETKLVVLIVLSSRSQKEFDSSLPAFAELVHSYFFISQNVVIDK